MLGTSPGTSTSVTAAEVIQVGVTSVREGEDFLCGTHQLEIVHFHCGWHHDQMRSWFLSPYTPHWVVALP